MTHPLRCSNITTAGERRRRASGIAALAAGVIVAAGLAWGGAPSVAWFAIFPFIAFAAFGLLQARARTCVVLGLRGTEEVEGGGWRTVQDEAVRAQARRQAMAVLWKALAIAVAVTLVAVIVSGIAVSS
ncbi:MAG: hypothetical protein H0X64_02910 [Gemmatimonadaceae bacterium]|nr:hypothetical protein [Gemmatimonadaceae bacterium]